MKVTLTPGQWTCMNKLDSRQYSGNLISHFQIFIYWQLSVSSVWSGRGHCITTSRLGQSWSQANTGHTSGLQTGISQRSWGFEDLSKGDKVITPLCFELNDAILFSPAGCCHWSEAVQAGSLVQCVLAVMLRPGDDRMFVFTNKYTTGDQEPLGPASRE